MHEYYIWIGDLLPPLTDLNLLNLNEYMYRGSIVIGFAAKGKVDTYGGTLLKYDVNTGLHFVKFKPSGKNNHGKISDAEHLLETIRFGGHSVNRVNYSLDSVSSGFFARRIHEPKVTYMACGGVELSSSDVSLIGQIMIEKVRFTSKFMEMYPQPVMWVDYDELSSSGELTQHQRQEKERQEAFDRAIHGLSIASAALSVQSATLGTLRAIGR